MTRERPSITRQVLVGVLTFCAIAAATLNTVRGDIVIYVVPGTRLAFLLEGKTSVNAGKTMTLRHAMGTVHLGLDDVKVIKVNSIRSIASAKLNSAIARKDVDACIEAARWCLHNGVLPKFYEALSAAWKIDSTNPTVRRLATMRQRIAARLPPPVREKSELEAFGKSHGTMDFAYSRHFILMHDTTGSNTASKRGGRPESVAQARLRLLETVYESFLMKFALEGYELEVPKEYLKVVLFKEHQDYLQFARLLSPALQSTAGFYEREKNISVFYAQGSSESFKELDALNRALQQKRDDAVKQRSPGVRELVRFADTLELVINLQSVNLDVEVVSHEATHHMAGNTGLMPGNAPVPVWAAEGLATYFESPKEAAWSGIGAVNEQRLDWYKQLERDTVHSNIDFIVSDRIFSLARTGSGRMHGYGQAWALTHFLMDRHFEKLMKWYQLVAARKQKRSLTPDQLLSSFRFVFGDTKTLEREWRTYMRSLKTDIERALVEASE